MQPPSQAGALAKGPTRAGAVLKAGKCSASGLNGDVPASRTTHEARASSSTVHRLGASTLATLFPVPDVVPVPRFPQRPKAMAVCVLRR